MLSRLLILSFCILGVSACSSPGGRAPVSDLTLGTNNSVKITPKKGRITGKSYTVQKGDTLYSIGWRSGVAVNKLIDQNNISNPYIIKVGQRLRLVDAKTLPAKKSNPKSDLSYKNVQKSTTSACETQKCQKNKSKKLEEEKPKAYSKHLVDKKMTNNYQQTIRKDKKVDDWSWPAQGKLTKLFSASESGKQGVSIVNVTGSPVVAAALGEVVYAGSGLGGYGNLIIIKHNYDYLSAYAHNKTLLVHEGEKIKKGQKIATMGDSGSDHVHLHFEIRYRGKSVDPLRYLPKR